jgi:hypothetical protein
MHLGTQRQTLRMNIDVEFSRLMPLENTLRIDGESMPSERKGEARLEGCQDTASLGKQLAYILCVSNRTEFLMTELLFQ